MKENVWLLKTTVAMIVHCLDDGKNDREDPEEDYSSDSSDSSIKPCSSQAVHKKI